MEKKYFKNERNELYVDPIVKNHENLKEIDRSEFDSILLINNTPSLEQVKTNKKQDLKTKFYEVSLEPVIVNGVSYYGGYDSAQKLDGKRRLIAESGGTEVTYFDTDRNYHTHTLQEALDVCVTIAMKYETDLEHYSNKLKEIDSKLKVSTVQSIVW